MNKRVPWNKGLTKYTDKRIKQLGLKISKSRKGKCMGDDNVAKRPDVRQKISLKSKNRKHSEESKRKIRLARAHQVISLTTRKKMSVIMKGNKNGFKTGDRHTDVTKAKMRKAAFNFAKQNNGIICPRIGKNEKKLLDKLEKDMGYTIDRAFTIAGYFPDGYIHELNLIVEIDERPKIKIKDIERENIIKQKLKCKFLRIKDYA